MRVTAQHTNTQTRVESFYLGSVPPNLLILTIPNIRLAFP